MIVCYYTYVAVTCGIILSDTVRHSVNIQREKRKKIFQETIINLSDKGKS